MSAPGMDDPRFRIRPYQQMLSSCTGALITSITMTPLDVVKVRIQTQQKTMMSNKCYLYCNGLMDHICPCGPGINASQKTVFNGTFDAMIKISRMEGITSLWSGLSPTLVLALPATVLYFVTYEQMRINMGDLYMKKTSDKNQPLWIPLVAGCLARVTAASVFSPLELVRTKMQSQKMSFSETRGSISKLLGTSGVSSLWRGLVPTLMRDVPFSGIYWMNYESIKKYFGHPNPNKNTVLFSFTAGAISGSLASVVTLPFDVVKTHQQIELGEKEIYSGNGKQKAKGMGEMMKNIYKNHGIRGLFSGLSPRIIKVAPACAIMISSFEYGKSFFQEYNHRKYMQKEESLFNFMMNYSG